MSFKDDLEGWTCPRRGVKDLTKKDMLKALELAMKTINSIPKPKEYRIVRNFIDDKVYIITNPITTSRDRLLEMPIRMVSEIRRQKIDETILKQHKKIEGLIIASSQLMKPIIKGKITKGKLKWRGIRLCSQQIEEGSYRYWIEQRGTIILSIIINQARFYTRMKITNDGVDSLKLLFACID